MTIALRLLIMIPLSFAAWALISGFTNTSDTLLRAALMVLFILPAPFVIPLFVDKDDEKEYISTTLSLNTLVSLVLYVVIIAFITT